MLGHDVLDRIRASSLSGQWPRTDACNDREALREYGPARALGVADSVSKRDLVFILAAQGILGSNPLEHDNRQQRRKSRCPLKVVRIDFNHGDDADDRLRRLFHTLLGPNGAVHDEDRS